MRLIGALLAALVLLAPAAPGRCAGAAYRVLVPSAGLYERPNAAEPFASLYRDQVVTVLQRRGEWLHIITEEGEEGWVRESTVSVIPMGEWEDESQISEASPDEVPVAVLYDFVVGSKRVNIRREPGITAPLAGQADPGEVFTIVATEGEWYQVAREGTVAGWMHKNLGTRRESTNLPLKLGEIVEARLAYFDQFKNEAPFFRRQGWFPSFFLRHAGQDIGVTELEGEDREVTVDLSYALRDIEYRMIINDADSFFLPGANRTFLADLMLSIFDAAPEVRTVRMNLWFADLDRNGTMTWRSMGGIVLGAEAAARISREGEYGESLWGVLEQDTTPPALWEGGSGE